jgi:hypothetical protein
VAWVLRQLADTAEKYKRLESTVNNLHVLNPSSGEVNLQLN